MYKLLLPLLIVSSAFAEPITIGALLPLTGPFANYGEKIRASFVDAAKAQGLNVIIEDEGCDPNKTVTAYKKLSDLNNVKIFFGPWCGSPQRALAEQLKTRDQIAILGSSAPEDLASVSNGKIFSSQYTIQSESRYLAQQMNERKAKRVVVIYFDNAFSRAHEDAFRSIFKGEIVDALRYGSNDDLKQIALKVKSLNPDAIYMPDAFPLLGGITKEFSKLKINAIPIYGVYSFQFPDVLTATQGINPQIIYSYPAIDEDALEYYPQKASSLLFEAIKSCNDDTKCIGAYLTSHFNFGTDGALSGAFKLKTVRNGTFQDF